jgi:putative acetyltransferase
MNLLRYSPGDTEEIKQLFTRVFSDSEGQSEGLLIGNLAHDLMTGTSAEDLYGFVAVEDERIIGSIFFTRMTFQSEVTAYILSPVAVQTKYHGKGIGQKLITFGIDHLKHDGVELVFTYGDPKFYSKVGFGLIAEKLVEAPFALTYPEGWLGQSLVSDEIEPIAGGSCCVDAFNNPEYW